MLNLKAENDNEKVIYRYLDENVSDTLRAKINGGKKTLAGFLQYARDKASALAQGGVACIEDETVFGWAIHYFEEDTIKQKKDSTVLPHKLPEASSGKRDEKLSADADKASKGHKKEVSNGQLDFFALMSEV